MTHKITIKSNANRNRVFLNGKHLIGTSVYPHMSPADIVENIYGNIYDSHMTEDENTYEEDKMNLGDGDEIEFAGGKIRFTEKWAAKKSLTVKPFTFRVAFDGTGHIEVLADENS